jgi:hypothetical protein
MHARRTLFACLALLVMGAQTAMALTPDQIIERLRHLDPNDEDAMQALSRQVAAEALAGPRAVVRQALSAEGPLAENAMNLVSRIPRQALGPLIDAAPARDQRRKLWRLATLVDTELAVREAVARSGEALLDDRTLLAAPAAGPRPEGAPPTPRVCDRAYLLLREMLKLDEDMTARSVTAGVFLHLPDADKDAAIAEFRKSGTWMNVLER